MSKTRDLMDSMNLNVLADNSERTRIGEVEFNRRQRQENILFAYLAGCFLFVGVLFAIGLIYWIG